MDIRIYVGPHKTASKHLSSILNANSELLNAENSFFHSNTSAALKLINNTLKSIAGGGDKADAIGLLLHSLTEGRDVKKLLLVSPNIVGNVTQPFGKELFYPRTTGLIHQLQTLFGDTQLQLFASTRNPASFLPSCYAQSLLNASFGSYNEFLKDVVPSHLKWSAFLQRLQGKQMDIPLTVWRFEDYPLIWRDVAQAFSGITNSQELIGDSKRINVGLTLHGAQLLHKYIEEHPPRTKEEFESAKSTFLEKFPSAADKITGPDWSTKMVQSLTHNYEDDWYYIERMETIKPIQPRQFS